MKIRTRKSIVQGLFLALVFILGLSGISWGAEFWLRAETLTKTMPDTSVITMWGFANCTDGTYTSCTAATVPGPRLTVPAGDTVLTINLRNNLTGPFIEPVSIVIPGLAPTTPMTPVKFTDSEGRQRVKSFAPETPPDNSTTVTYSWTAKPGTYLYESGSHPAVQVQMGLYGAVTSDAAAGQAYGPSTAYLAEAVLLFSEIDPVLHGHVAAGTYGTAPPAGITSIVDYEPRYFLINGEPFTPAALHIPAGTSGQALLLRFLSAGLKPRVPTINGMNVFLVAEDGNLYPYPKEQYSILLSPGKTIDALVTPPRGGEYPVFDRRLGLTNDTASSGGMLTYLSVVAGPDVTPPTGSVVINGGAASTNNLAVVLTLSATDLDSAVTDMNLSWDNVTWLGWEPYATTRNISIPAGPAGTKTIYVQFRDAVGNVSLTYQDSINYSPITITSPTNLTAAINSGPRITMTWTDASNNETSFAIWRSDNGGAFTQIGTVTRTATQSTATGGTVSYNNYNVAGAPLVVGHIYSYYVTAVNAGGASAPSSTVVVNYSIPAAPTGLSGASVVLNATQDTVTLNWTDNSNNETSFQIQRANNATFTSSVAYFYSGANTTSYIQSVLRSLPTLYYRVRALNGLGYSGWSNAVSVTTP